MPAFCGGTWEGSSVTPSVRVSTPPRGVWIMDWSELNTNNNEWAKKISVWQRTVNMCMHLFTDCTTFVCIFSPGVADRNLRWEANGARGMCRVISGCSQATCIKQFSNHVPNDVAQHRNALTITPSKFINTVSYTDLALTYVCIFYCPIMCFLCLIVYSLYYFYQRPL